MAQQSYFPYGYWSNSASAPPPGSYAAAPPPNIFDYQPGSLSVPQSWYAAANNQAANAYAQRVAEAQYRNYVAQVGSHYGVAGQQGPPGTQPQNMFSQGMATGAQSVFPNPFAPGNAAGAGGYGSFATSGAGNPFAPAGYSAGATPGYGVTTPSYGAGSGAGIPAFNTQTGGPYVNYGLGGQINPTYPGNPFSTLYNVKSPEINTRIDTALSGLDQMTRANASELDNFIGKYKSNTPAIAANVGQENDVVSRYYNGGVKNDLDALSQQKSAALRTAGDRALDFARHGIALAALSRGGGDSSYLRQMGLDQSRGIESNIATTNAQDARDNYNYVQAGQLGLRGQRGTALDDLAKRELAPAVARSGLFNNTTDNLAKLGQAKLSNSFYSVAKDPNTAQDPVQRLFTTGFNPYA